MAPPCVDPSRVDLYWVAVSSCVNV